MSVGKNSENCSRYLKASLHEKFNSQPLPVAYLGAVYCEFKKLVVRVIKLLIQTDQSKLPKKQIVICDLIG